jgi:RNA polymerase sporulation-specific sigma factor
MNVFKFLKEDELIKKYNFLVIRIAKSYLEFSIDPLEDLIQVGLIALIKAYRRFDKSKNIRIFEKYAKHYIKGYIKHYLRDKQNLLKNINSNINIIWIDDIKKDRDHYSNEYLLEDAISLKKQEDIENKIFLDNLISKLDDNKKKIIKLRYFDNLTQTELSKVIGTSQMEVSRLLKKIEKEIRELINS